LKLKTPIRVTIPRYTTYSNKARAAAASEAISSGGPIKAVGECLVSRFERLAENGQEQEQQYQQQEQQQEQQQHHHDNDEPTATTATTTTAPTALPTIPKPQATATTSTKPNKNTKSSSLQLAGTQRNAWWRVFIILAWLFITNAPEVNAGVKSVSSVTLSNSTQLLEAATATTLTQSNINNYNNVLTSAPRQSNGVHVRLHKRNNEVIYAASDETIPTTTPYPIGIHFHLTTLPPSSTLSTHTNPSSFNGSSTNSSSTIDEGEVPQIPAYIRTTAMFFCIVIMLMGVIGNVMVPIVIIRTKDMRNSTNIFLTNLSIADLLVLLVCTPTVLVELNTKPETWILGHEMCKAVPFIELTVAHASVLTILAISFERYYAICEPLKAGYVCTKTRAILICSLAWGIAALFTSPILWMAEYKFADYIDGSSVPVCLTQALTIWTLGFFLMITAVFFVFPLFILIVLYGIIAKNLISDTGPMMRIRPIKPELSLKARKQVVLMLGAVVVSFFLCLLPFRLLTLGIILAPDKVHDLGLERYYNVLYFSRIMLYLNSAINPILYNLMSTKFRKGFYKLIFTLWMAVLAALTCGHCERCGVKRKGPHGLVTTTTTSSNTNTTTNTSSSILSRSSNRRSSDEVYNRTRVQIQMQMPYGSDCEMVAMLHNTNTDCRAAVVVAASLPGLSGKYGAMKCHGNQRRCSTSSSSSLQTNAQPRHVICGPSSRLRARQISFEEDANVDANAIALATGPKQMCFLTIILDERSPIIFIAQYRLETYYDGSVEAVCFTAADTFWSAFYFIGSITIFFLIPFAILVLLYTAIAYKLLRRHSEFQRPTSPQSHPPLSPSGINNTPSSSQHLAHRRGTTTNVNSHPQNNNLRKHRQQVIFMLVAVVASFFICLLPFRAFTIWIIASPPKDVIALGLEGYYNVLYFCRIMLYLNSALNPILYNLMSSKFRTGFWRLLLSCCSSHKRKRGLCNRHITTYTKRDANNMANSHSLRSRRPFRREATFLVNSISTSSGTERTSITWRSASTSTSTTGNSGKPPPLPESHSLAAAITDMSTTAVLTTMYFN
uniref:G-protein coupled receptors family 1 profile domain-containing protein n=1 Tax=Musca domestica TaxID=7370 RepID=A0A1I8MAM1_MUSDO